MSDNVGAGLPNRGQTYYQGRNIPKTYDKTSVSIEGTAVEFMDTGSAVGSNGVGPRKKISGQVSYAKLVRNTSGGDLLVGAAVTFEVGYKNRRVDAIASAGPFDGLIDNGISSLNVAEGDLFWLFYGGPAKGTAIGAIADGESVVAGVSGTIGPGAAAWDNQDTADESVASGDVRVNLKGRQQ